MITALYEYHIVENTVNIIAHIYGRTDIPYTQYVWYGHAGIKFSSIVNLKVLLTANKVYDLVMLKKYQSHKILHSAGRGARIHI